ncbi:MAG: HAD family hydrolase [Deltaproteobacteria bacterium]|nr:HAD family hydrolase [Deltaproteobacteria bacterium]
MSELRAISVDLDGTLYRVRRLRVAWRLARSRSVLVAFLEARERVRREGPFKNREELVERELEMVINAIGLPRAEVEPKLRALVEQLPDALTEGFAPFEGARETLVAATERGLAIAVLSDYAPAKKLENLGLKGLPWAVAIGGEEIGALKPSPRAFHSVAERLGLEPSRILHIGDREDLDVEGALAAGFRAWRFSPREKHPTKASFAFSRWSPDILDRVER